jgi:hypothetical protein
MNGFELINEFFVETLPQFLAFLVGDVMRGAIDDGQTTSRFFVRYLYMCPLTLERGSH